MPEDIVRVAVVGAGRTGGPLIEALLDIPYVRLVGVADHDQGSPGALLAQSRGVFFTKYADVLAAKAQEIDLIIDVTGDPEIKPSLRDAFRVQGNRETIIVHDLVARLILSLARDLDHLAPSFHPDDRGVG
jgi:predicted homoserine dehydrogenase-like protein